MYLLFMFTINVGGALYRLLRHSVWHHPLVDGLGRLLSAIGMPDLITVVLADGMGGRYSNRGHLYPG